MRQPSMRRWNLRLLRFPLAEKFAPEIRRFHISQTKYISVISSEASNLKSETGQEATISDSSLRSAAFGMTTLGIYEVVSEMRAGGGAVAAVVYWSQSW